MQHPALHKWEKLLKQLLDEVDDALEDQFGSSWQRHPARPERGSTANKAHDGLFDITANFSLGIGSEIGRGYSIDIHIATLDSISTDLRRTIENTALNIIREKLPEHFPERSLSISRDGSLLKLHGDLSLGHSETK